MHYYIIFWPSIQNCKIQISREIARVPFITIDYSHIGLRLKAPIDFVPTELIFYGRPYMDIWNRYDYEYIQ